MLVKHEKLDVSAEIDKDFSQSQYEKYQEALIEKGKEYKSISAKSRIVVEAAQESGILKEIHGDLEKPAVIKWLTIQVLDAEREALDVPLE